jgi:acetyl-CoA C-acetyltransferase
MSQKTIVIASAARTPIGKFNGYFKDIPATTLGTQVIQATLQRGNFPAEKVQEVLMGCVLSAGLGQAPARQAAIHAGIPTHVGCTTINKICGSGMKSVIFAHDAILAGSYEAAIAGGMENMTRAPYLLAKARFGYRMGKAEIFDHMMLDGLEDAYDQGRAMGYFAEKCVAKYHISREEQDAFASASVRRAQTATQQGWFKKEIIPVTVASKEGEQIIEVDEGPLNVDIHKISQLKPAFLKEGTITAANSSSISDGAAALLILSENESTKSNCTPLARIIGHATQSQDPEWFTTANIGAINTLLKKISWKIADVDLFEINEAFAVVPMATMRELNIPHEKVNVNGGGCVLGHPIGASGARILVTLIYALQQRNLKRGIASICIGGGEATAIAVEI